MKVTRIACSYRLNPGKYAEALTDSDGNHHGTRLGSLLTAESDRINERNRRRVKLRPVTNAAALRGDRAKADRIARNTSSPARRAESEPSVNAHAQV